MEKMRMESMDMAAHNIALLGRLFPGCVTERADAYGNRRLSVNMEMLQQLLEDTVLPGEESYAFTWVGKKAAIVEANKPIRKTLRAGCVGKQGMGRNKKSVYPGPII